MATDISSRPSDSLALFVGGLYSEIALRKNEERSPGVY
jgi:hypothetical protein